MKYLLFLFLLVCFPQFSELELNLNASQKKEKEKRTCTNIPITLIDFDQD